MCEVLSGTFDSNSSPGNPESTLPVRQPLPLASGRCFQLAHVAWPRQTRQRGFGFRISNFASTPSSRAATCKKWRANGEYLPDVRAAAADERG